MTTVYSLSRTDGFYSGVLGVYEYQTDAESSIDDYISEMDSTQNCEFSVAEHKIGDKPMVYDESDERLTNYVVVVFTDKRFYVEKSKSLLKYKLIGKIVDGNYHLFVFDILSNTTKQWDLQLTSGNRLIKIAESLTEVFNMKKIADEKFFNNDEEYDSEGEFSDLHQNY